MESGSRPFRALTPTGQGFDIFREPKSLGFEKDAYFDSSNRYCSDVLTDEGLRFIEEHLEQPFFLYLATHDLHAALDPKPELIEKYGRKASKSGEDSDEINQAAMVEAVDANVGRILAKLSSSLRSLVEGHQKPGTHFG